MPERQKQSLWIVFRTRLAESLLDFFINLICTLSYKSVHFFRKVTKITFPVSDIYHINNQVYIETKHSLYQLLGIAGSLDKVERYLTNPNLTSEEFFNKYVPNLPLTEHGWRIF